MKKIILLFALSILTISVFAQKSKVEILYFKAQLPCCQARACNALEVDMKEVIDKNFKENVSFKQIALADDTNKALVNKHKAKSQTVILVAIKNKKESILDISEIIRKYARSNDKATLEKELVSKIKQSLN